MPTRTYQTYSGIGSDRDDRTSVETPFDLPGQFIGHARRQSNPVLPIQQQQSNNVSDDDSDHEDDRAPAALPRASVDDSDGPDIMVVEDAGGVQRMVQDATASTTNNGLDVAGNAPRLGSRLLRPSARCALKPCTISNSVIMTTINSLAMIMVDVRPCLLLTCFY